jgi:hypothetical protein
VGGGRAAAGGRGERHYTSHNHRHTDTHIPTCVWGRVHNTRHERHAVHTQIQADPLRFGCGALPCEPATLAWAASRGPIAEFRLADLAGGPLGRTLGLHGVACGACCQPCPGPWLRGASAGRSRSRGLGTCRSLPYNGSDVSGSRACYPGSWFAFRAVPSGVVVRGARFGRTRVLGGQGRGHVSQYDAIPACAHPPAPHATRTYTQPRTCAYVHTHTTAHTQCPVLMPALRAPGGCVTPLPRRPSHPPAHL